jgi:RimJ/RimL family protein N-acetyltransferase
MALSVHSTSEGPQGSSAVGVRSHIPIGIRPLRSDDRERETAFLDALSEESRYLRLLSPQKFLPKHLIDQLMNIDGATSMAFVAAVGDGGHERFVGIARYGATDRADTAEIGITVADDFRRQGIATRLMKTLQEYAIARGVNQFIGFVLPQNLAMQSLAKRLGFSSRRGDDGLVHIALNLVEVAHV